MESYVKLSTEKYEELAKKCLMLDMLAESYKKMPPYRFEDVLKVFFDAPEENAADTEDGKC